MDQEIKVITDSEIQAYQKGLFEGRNESPLFAIIPIEILERKDLSANSKLLYAEIMALSKKSGKCYATNEHLAEILGLSKRSVPQLLKELSGTGLVVVSIKRDERGTYRNITVSCFNEGGHQSLTRGGIVKERGQKRNRQREIDNKTLSTDKVESVHGNPIINELVEHFQTTIQGSLDGTQHENRRYCFLLLKRFAKDFPTRNSGELVKLLITQGSGDKFHGKNLTNFKYLYYNAMKIVQSLKSDVNKNQITKIS